MIDPTRQGVGVQVGSVVIDCNDFPRMSAFWRDALGYVTRGPVEDDFVILRDPEGRNVNVSLQGVPERRVGKNRLHFDLYTTDQEGEVERLLGLGATRHPRIPEPDEDFIVLADPEGNLFCVVDTSRIQSGFALVEGGRLYYEEAGAGPPVVLVHAGMWDSRMWEPQMDALASRHRVIRYDLRGFGRSDRLAGPFSHRQDLADLMAKLGIPSAAVVGCSVGGSFALDFTIEHPEKVDALVLVAPGLSGDDTPDDERTAEVMEQAEAAMDAGDIEGAVDLQLQVWTPPSDDPEADRWLRDMAMDNRHVDTLDWSLSRRLDPPAAGRLDEVRTATLVILGDRDAPVMATIADKVVTGIQGARKEVIAGADHLPNVRRPEEFNRLVLEFL